MDELATKLLAEARRSASGPSERSRLSPYRDAIMAFRAKNVSYERIAAMLTKHGIVVAASSVGCYCRMYCSKADIARAGMEPAHAVRTAQAAPPVSESRWPTGRPPRIARDDL